MKIIKIFCQCGGRGIGKDNDWKCLDCGLKKNYRELNLTITGRPCSKKNSRINFYRNGRGWSLPSKAYEQFKHMAIIQLKQLFYSRDFLGGFTKPVNVHYVFYQKGKMKQDFDNAIASINDVLQDAGIIVNDSLIKGGTFRIVNESLDWSTELKLSSILQ